MTDAAPLDLDAIEEKIHDAPPSELTPVALTLLAEVRRLREMSEGHVTPEKAYAIWR